MPEDGFRNPDLSLLVGPDDSVDFIGAVTWRTRRGRLERSLLYAVVHRGCQVWTHVYRVVRDRPPDRLLVHLEKILEGDRAAEARRWVASRPEAGPGPGALPPA